MVLFVRSFVRFCLPYLSRSVLSTYRNVQPTTNNQMAAEVVVTCDVSYTLSLYFTTSFFTQIENIRYVVAAHTTTKIFSSAKRATSASAHTFHHRSEGYLPVPVVQSSVHCQWIATSEYTLFVHQITHCKNDVITRFNQNHLFQGTPNYWGYYDGWSNHYLLVPRQGTHALTLYYSFFKGWYITQNNNADPSHPMLMSRSFLSLIFFLDCQLDVQNIFTSR